MSQLRLPDNGTDDGLRDQRAIRKATALLKKKSESESHGFESLLYNIKSALKDTLKLVGG